MPLEQGRTLLGRECVLGGGEGGGTILRPLCPAQTLALNEKTPPQVGGITTALEVAIWRTLERKASL